MKMREPGVPTVDEFLEMNLAKGSCLACDGRVISVSQGKAYKKMMEDKEGRFYCQEDLLDGIWNDRPELYRMAVKHPWKRYYLQSGCAFLCHCESRRSHFLCAGWRGF